MGSIGNNETVSTREQGTAGSRTKISETDLKNLSLEDLRVMDRNFQEQINLMNDRLATISSNNAPAYTQ